LIAIANDRGKRGHDSRLGESSTGCIQARALFAERSIVCPVSMMILFNITAFQARRIVVMNRFFVCGPFCFR